MKKRKFQTGGDVEEQKRKGLGASAGEKVGFFERLRMGNIDDPTSEAYKRFGAGRGSSEIQKEREAIKEYKGSANPFQGDDVDPFGAARDASGNINRSASTNGDKSGVKPAAPPKPVARVSKPRNGERSIQPSSQDIDRLEAATTAARMRDERTAYMQERDAQAAARSASERAAERRAYESRPTRDQTGLQRYASILEEGKKRRAAARENQVPPRPSRAFSSPAARREWDEKYGDKYDTSGNRKPGMKAGGMVKSSVSRRADGCAVRGKTRGKMV